MPVSRAMTLLFEALSNSLLQVLGIDPVLVELLLIGAISTAPALMPRFASDLNECTWRCRRKDLFPIVRDAGH